MKRLPYMTEEGIGIMMLGIRLGFKSQKKTPKCLSFSDNYIVHVSYVGLYTDILGMAEVVVENDRWNVKRNYADYMIYP